MVLYTHTHTHTHTHTCISLKEEKRVDNIYFKSVALKLIVTIILVSVEILNNIYDVAVLAIIYVFIKNNLIFKVERLLFSKLSYYCLVC